MGRIARAAKTAGKKTAGAVGRSSGRLAKRAIKSGYEARAKREKREGT